MTEFINETGVIGIIIEGSVQYITGSLDSSLFLIFLILILMTIGFRIPIEIGLLIVFPLVLVIMSYMDSWVLIGGCMLVFFAVLIVKHFWLGD
jgi:hypothetical protein